MTGTPCLAAAAAGILSAIHAAPRGSLSPPACSRRPSSLHSAHRTRRRSNRPGLQRH